MTTPGPPIRCQVSTLFGDDSMLIMILWTYHRKIQHEQRLLAKGLWDQMPDYHREAFQESQVLSELVDQKKGN